MKQWVLIALNFIAILMVGFSAATFVLTLAYVSVHPAPPCVMGK